MTPAAPDVLLADWARAGGRPVAWLSLDPGDNDPVPWPPDSGARVDVARGSNAT